MGNVIETHLMDETRLCFYDTVPQNEEEMRKRETEHVNILQNQGFSYSQSGNYLQALNCYQQALDIQVDTLEYSTDSVLLASTWNNLGIAHFHLDQFERSLFCYWEALRIKKINKSKDLSNTLFNIGVVHNAQGQNEMATAMFDEALEIAKDRLLGQGSNYHHPDVANILQKKGVSLRQSGEHICALRCFQDALNIRKNVYGSNHHGVAESMRDVGLQYYKLIKLDEAIKYLTSAAHTYEEVLGRHRLETAMTLFNLAHAFDLKDDVHKCQQSCREALETLLKLKTDHPDTLGHSPLLTSNFLDETKQLVVRLNNDPRLVGNSKLEWFV